MIASSFSFSSFLISLLELLDVRGRDHGLEAHPGARLVHHVDRLVGEEAAVDVAVREVDAGLQRLVRVADAVVGLVLVAQALHDLEALVAARRLDDDRLEAALEGAVLLDVLAVLVERGRADALDLAARERRLEHVGGVDRAFRAAGADQGVRARR